MSKDSVTTQVIASDQAELSEENLEKIAAGAGTTPPLRIQPPSTTSSDSTTTGILSPFDPLSVSPTVTGGIRRTPVASAGPETISAPSASTAISAVGPGAL